MTETTEESRPRFYRWLLTATAKSLQSCPTLCDPIDRSPPGSLSLGFPRQEHWSGLPFPSLMHKSEDAQSCPTPSDPMDCSLPGSSVHGIFQARVVVWPAIAFPDDKPRQHIKKQRHYFDNKSSSSQSYGFSSSHVWM